jgi:ribosomal protein S26
MKRELVKMIKRIKLYLKREKWFLIQSRMRSISLLIKKLREKQQKLRGALIRIRSTTLKACAITAIINTVAIFTLMPAHILTAFRMLRENARIAISMTITRRCAKIRELRRQKQRRLINKNSKAMTKLLLTTFQKLAQWWINNRKNKIDSCSTFWI